MRAFGSRLIDPDDTARSVLDRRAGIADQAGTERRLAAIERYVGSQAVRELPIVVGGGNPANYGAAELVVEFDDDATGDEMVWGKAFKTGLGVTAPDAMVRLEASTQAWIDDDDHNYNVALRVENYTKDGAGIVVHNPALGDGIFVQASTETFPHPDVPGLRAGIGINVWQGNPTLATAEAIGVQVQRFGVGPALNIEGKSGSSGEPVVRLVQEANTLSIEMDLDESTTANSVNWTMDGKTSGHFLSLFHAVSSWSGRGIYMNVGNSGGSFSGHFLSCEVGGSGRLYVLADGSVYTANTSDPSTPTGGGILYAKAGGLYWRGSGGTITNLAPA